MKKIVHILLQRSDRCCSWGFQLMGGKEYDTVVTIHKTLKGTLAAQYLTAGDVVLFIERKDTRQLTLDELNAIISASGDRLELTVLKTSSRQSSQISGIPAAPTGSTNMAQPNGAGDGGMGAPPPPPPPPPMPSNGTLPAIKLNSEVGHSNMNKSGGGGGKHVPGGGAPFSYIPPAAIQNAMMTKDKKPFTYTPGGIDFLAEIRSPRMQRRISKNAADDGSHHHPHQQYHPSPLASASQLTPQAIAAMQPQMAVPVFPPTPVMTPPTPATPRSPHPLTVSHPPTPHIEPASPPPPPPPPATPIAPFNDEPMPPPPPPLRKTASPVPVPLDEPDFRSAPRNPQPQPSVPIVERRNAQVGSIYIPPVSSTTIGAGNSAGSNAGSAGASAVSPISAQLHKAPMPWMNSQNKTNTSPPAFVQQLEQTRVIPVEREEVSKVNSSNGHQVRIIPIAVEGRLPPVVAASPAPATTPAASATSAPIVPPWQNSAAQVIPIHLESAAPVRLEPAGRHSPFVHQPQQQQQHHQLPHQHQFQHQQQYQQQQQPQQQQGPWRAQSAPHPSHVSALMEELSMSSPTHNGRYEDPMAAANRHAAQQQPTQSRSFRILQMITDTADEGCPESEMIDSGRLSRSSVGSNGSGGGRGPPMERRLVLTQDDRELMDMFRSQVSEDQSLHQESDPRYRGSHIPSRAFRILQNFTDSSEDGYQQQPQAPGNRPQVVSPPPQNQSNVTVGRGRAPPSEQTVPEPRKYMGGNIPSRSFRMLQAMTALDPNDGQSDL